VSYKKVVLEQDSPEWHKWRNEGIGASDAPIVLGISPYKTAFGLWQEKRGLVVPAPASEFVIKQGKEFEKRVRAKFELITGKEYPPMCIESIKYPFIRASLDGYDEGTIIEIKMNGAKQFESEEIPEHHYAQFQQQMYVADAKDMIEIYGFIDKFGETQHKKRVVTRDDVFIDGLIDKLKEFWEMVKNGNAPEETKLKRKKK
jgi:putative phage-type endonuclease